MNTEQLNRTLGLLRRTGDKAIVLDPASEHIFVMMDLDDYEGLLDETDFPVGNNSPKSKNGSGHDEEDPLQDYVLDDVLPTEVKTTSAEQPFLTPEELTETTLSVSALKKESQNSQNSAKVSQKEPTLEWVEPASAVSELKPQTVLSEESLADVPNEEEEEKFYLEPVDEV